MVILMILAALHLPVLSMLLRKRAGQEAAATFFSVYIIINLLLTVIDGLTRGVQLTLSERGAIDLQAFGAFILSFIALISILHFVRRNSRNWLIVGGVWLAGFFAIVINLFRFGEIVWTNGALVVTFDRLAPIWAGYGWLVFTAGAIVIVRMAHDRSRQPLLRNRLNYWMPAFLLIVINDGLLFLGMPIPGNPARLCAAVIGALIIVTHDPPDLRNLARRALTYVITTLVILIFYVAGATASQSVFNALPNYNPLVVGAGIALVLALIFIPLLTSVRRLVNNWFNL